MNFSKHVKQVIRSFFVVLFMFQFITCTLAQSKYLYKLNSSSDFKMLSGNPLSNKYGEVDAVKVVYDIKTDRIYYLNSRNYKYHHGFCSTKLGYRMGLEYFNEHNYSEDSEHRTFLLGNINYYRSIDKYIMDLSPADLIQVRDIEFLHKKILESTYIQELTLLLNTSRLLSIEHQFQIPYITPENIFKDQTYQAIGINSCYGILKFVSKEELKTTVFAPSDIIVLNETPNTLPYVAGIITSEFQTPLSHLSILGRNRNIPIMAKKGAFGNSNLRKYADKYVQLIVKKNEYIIQPAINNNFKRNRRRLAPIALKRDLSVDTLVTFDKLKKVSSRSVGNKARNFAVLAHLSKTSNFTVPEASFAIPFFYYDQHIRTSKTDTLINCLLEDIDNGVEIPDLKDRLQSIRSSIVSSSIDPKFLKDVLEKLSSEKDYKKFRFRSSTNAEDADGFGGAGLYQSKTGIIGDSTKTVELAIKKVWASLWRYSAFTEREYFRIDRRKVAMGILVHRSFPNELANGVAITKNIYRSSNTGTVINVQLGDESVVDPEPGVSCDQLVCYESAGNKIYTNKNIIEVITKSSLNNNQLIMSEEEIIHLVKQLDIIKRYYFERDSYINYSSYGLDIEFKLDSEKRILYIKQVRYYNG